MQHPNPPADLPFETKSLRDGLTRFLNATHEHEQVGNFRWGVYAFYDYDLEPIYVGQTNERLRTRIRRHLTNQRTDAVAMSVLDPFEVFEIEVWPLPQYEDSEKTSRVAKSHLDRLERTVFDQLIAKSRFGAILNEKPPPDVSPITPPPSVRGRIVDDAVLRFRGHPDVRLARRALIISRLAQVVSERKVQTGLRRVLEIQAKRLLHMASERAAAATEK